MKKQSKKTEKMTLQKVADLVEDLAQATSRGFDRIHNEVEVFKNDTAENFRRVRNDIFEIKDNYVTKQELAKVEVRIEKLEKQR